MVPCCYYNIINTCNRNIQPIASEQELLLPNHCEISGQRSRCFINVMNKYHEYA